jgi:sulfite exporter TauE/SafE
LRALAAPLHSSWAPAWMALLLALPLLLFALRPAEPPAWLGRLYASGARSASAWPSTLRALALGLLTPLLPCGLFWAAAASAALAPTAGAAAGWMLAFAAGSLPLLALSQFGWSRLGAARGAWGPRLQRLSAFAAAMALLAMQWPLPPR